ncbi:MAG: DsbE family thiol:disulfide interchange protein, partial [Alphaproteobacteria bacterium]
VNVIASWCVPCRAEHPLLNRLAKEQGVLVYGINHKDKPADARRFLDQLGNPYRRIGVDADGRASIEWGVYGVPETFVIDRAGRVRYRHVGALGPQDFDPIVALVEKLRK